MNKKKVLHVPYGGLAYGGVSSVIFSIVECLHKEIDFDCVVFNTVGDTEKKFEQYGNLHRLKCYAKNGKHSFFERLTRDVRLFFGIRKICRAGKYDAIHVHNGDDAGICLLAAKLAGVKVRIAHSHNTPTDKRLPLFKRIKMGINRARVNRYATSKVGCSALACKSYFGTDDFEVIPNATDTSRFDIRERKDTDGKSFIHVGRYTYQKNQSFAIDVFERILKRMPGATLTLIGFGEDEQMLRDKINDLGLTESITMVPGEGCNVAEYMARADYMIFPSVFEGFGIVLIEAQAMGVYCFASDAVQPEADAGMLKIIPLGIGADAWAEHITSSIAHGTSVDAAVLEQNIKKFRKEEIAKKYERIYTD